MPFKSEKQRRLLWAKHPEIAKRWAHEPGAKNKDLPMRKRKRNTEAMVAAIRKARKD